MFWRFGFHNASAIESLIDKEASLATILDQDDLLQECKAQNSRLAEYFGRIGVLHRLFAYVTGEIEVEGKDRFKYPYVATEVLCSDIWSISATCVGKADVVLAPFWEFVLDRSPDDMKTRMVMASHFVKINLGFILKWPEKMLAFIQSQPNIVERLLKHIECSSFVDLIVQIISLDEHQSCGEVIEWLSSQQFVPRLVDMLSPEYSSDMHNAVADLIKGIISMATPTPASGLIDSPPVSNLFARELASKEIVDKLVSYIVHDFSVPKPPSTSSAPTDSTSSTNTETTTESEFDADRLPSLDSSVSSVTNSISIIIELIRKNNSDYFEPYLFHTLRNRLIHFQQHLTEEAGKNPDETREMLEQAMADLVNRMGVVNLSFVLSGVGEKMHELKIFLREPRSLVGNIQTTVGIVTPLTFERFRISELLAELLHCSNMALLNRPSIHDNLYDSKGRLQGGLSALEDLAQVIQLNGTSDGEDKSGFDGGDTTEEDSDDDDDDDGLGASGSSGGMSDIEPAMDLPISGGPGSKLSSQQFQQGDGIGATVERDTPSIGSSDMSPGSSDAEDDDDSESGGGEGDVERMEEISMHDEPSSGKEGLKIDTSPKTMLDVGVGSDSGLSASLTALAPSSSKHARSSAESGSGDIDIQMSTGSSSEFDDHALTPQLSRTSKASNSRRSSRKMTTESAPDLSQTPGSKLKRLFLDLEILPTLLDLFFEFKWNNFLHSAVYDVIHQILTGNVESGLNRDLVISLFKDAKLMQRIVEGQKLNDIKSTKPKGVRIGYMGHLTLLAEDVISAIDRFPTDLQALIITSYAPRPEWEDYVKGRYSETKKKDRIALGGPKPSASVSSAGFSGSSSGSGGGGNGVFGFDGDGVEAKAFGAGAGVGGGVGVGGGGGIGRMAVDETAMFPGLRLDETNADTFAPRSSTKSSSRIEIEQGDIEGIASGPGGVERKADVPEDVGGSSSTSSSSRSNGGGRSGGPTGEFRRIGFDGGNKSSSRRSAVAGVRNTADFGPSVVSGHEDEDEEDEEKYGNSRTTHFARYLAQEIQSSNHIGESSDSSDEEEGGWLSQSNFNLGSPPISARRLQAERRPLDVSGFDDSFVPPTSSSTNPFSHDDDTFGPFSDTAATSNPSDSVLLSSSSFSDEMDDSSFESFGDFGDFHSADGAFDVDFGPFESAAPSSSSGPATVTGLSSTSTTTTTPSINTSSSSRVKDGDDDGDSSLTLTPTSGSGSWTIATGNDGFEEIRRA